MHKKKKSYKFLLYFNIILVLITILSGFAGDVDPRDTSLFSFLGLVFPMLVLSNIFFIIYWLIFKLRFTLLSLICILFFYQQIQQSFASNIIQNDIEEVDSFKIMSYNTSNFRNGASDKKTVIEKRKKAIQFITKTSKPDILCTQELSGLTKNILIKNWKRYYLHQVNNKGALIFSKYPIIKKGEIDFKTITNSCLWADLIIKNDTVRVYSVHLQSNKISKDTDELLGNEKIKDWSKLTTIAQRYKKYNILRAAQADRIFKHLKKSPHPIILCGDLNDTPQSYTYKTISANLTDAFVEKGWGIGATFGGKIPGLRIDYILPSDDFKIINFYKYKSNYSDHYPITTTLKLK